MLASTGGAALQPASALTTPGDTLPHFPSPGLHGLARDPASSSLSEKALASPAAEVA